MTPRSTQTVFDQTASSYDEDRARLIPGCDDFYRWAVDLIPSSAARIVDLGAGSGLLTRLLRNRFPAAEIVMVDFSAPMLEQARKRLLPDSRLTIVTADYTSYVLPERLDAVVSALSIHHLDDSAKRRLFTRIHSALAAGGVFINADQVAGPTPALEAQYKMLWLRQVRALGATPAQIEASLYRQQEDRCSPVADQLEWMSQAGFHDVDCWWKASRFAVLAGTRD
jgi:tRNA (cmo5U34)-methyltransferase